MSLEIIQTEQAPKAVGPYSQAIKVGNWLFCSGQIGIDPNTGELVSSDFVEQANQVLKNLQAVIQAAGTDLTKIVKVEVFLTDLGYFSTFNQIYAHWLGDHKPARQTIGVASLPKNALIEVSLIAWVE
jgi:2-iminobutanoate/2-iminopropanoate deaminase